MDWSSVWGHINIHYPEQSSWRLCFSLELLLYIWGGGRGQGISYQLSLCVDLFQNSLFSSINVLIFIPIVNCFYYYGFILSFVTFPFKVILAVLGSVHCIDILELTCQFLYHRLFVAYIYKYNYCCSWLQIHTLLNLLIISSNFLVDSVIFGT